MDQNEYIKKWLNNSLSEEEREVFEKTQDYQFLKRLDDSLMKFKAPDFDPQDKVDHLSFDEIQPKVRMLWSSTFLRVAATVFIAFGLAAVYYFVDPSDRIEVASHEKSELFLPDSSLVRLNVSSTLAYENDNWTKNRQVNLEGEAFFRVAHGSQFDVVTPSGTIRVVGTRFNVKSRPDYFEVSCFEGKVKVITKEREVFLEKAQSWRKLDSVEESIPLPLTAAPDWMEGESRFKSVPLVHVVEEFERQYDIKVQLENLNKQRLFTGSFAHDNVNLALKSISLPLNLSYKLEKDQVLLYGAQ